METLESKLMCRLCGTQLHNKMAINIFGSPENYEKKIRTVLPILIYEMDCLPKYLCYNCSHKLQEFHNFYMQTMKLDIEMKSKLSWMQKTVEENLINPPTVYFADLKSLKIKEEIENFTDYNIPHNNTKCLSIEKSNHNFHEDKFNCLPTTASDNNEKHYENISNISHSLLSSVKIPLVRINNKVRNTRINIASNSKMGFTDTQKSPSQELTKYSQFSNYNTVIPSNNINNNNNNYYKNNNHNDNSYSLIRPQVLIKSEAKENNEFVRKLRPRQKSINNQFPVKVIKEEFLNESLPIEINKNMRDLMTDLKLKRKVEIKLEKLNYDTKTQCKKIVMHINNNSQCDVFKKPKREIKNNVIHQMRPLRSQNNLKEMETYKSKNGMYMKGIGVRLTKINIDQLKKKVSFSGKSRNKISKVKRIKKIPDTFSCGICNKLFKKRELYRLHFCYYD